MSFALAEVVRATGADVVRRGSVVDFSCVATDTRSLPDGALFVALRGERYDAHRFLGDAVAAGARGVLVEDAGAVGDVGELTVLAVPDSLRALQDLASARRHASEVRVVGITGSNGKTTTKEMLAAILEVAAGAERVLKTEGNLNNLIGLPLTLLRLTGCERFAVVEMGMSVPGEIARLTEIADPDVGIVTNVGPVHLAGVGGTIEGVARAKGELFARMRKTGVAIANADDPRVTALADAFGGRVVRFGTGGDVTAEDVGGEPGGPARFRLRLAGAGADVALRVPGRHHVANALAAAAAAHVLDVGIDAIAAGLGRAGSVGNRMRVVTLPSGATLVNDSYNANPVSTASALRTLAEAPARRRIAVLGDMLELGPESAAHHRAIGRLAAELGIDGLWFLGDFAADAAAGAAEGRAGADVHVAATHAEIADAIARDASAGDWVLVKGSRGRRMEEVARLLGAPD